MNKILKNDSVFIIAEIGVNHNGNLKLAKKLIKAAKLAGADAVKFQTFKADSLATEDAPTAKYQRKATGKNSQYKMLKKLELTKEQFRQLFSYCQKVRILFLSTPFSQEDARFLNKLPVPCMKISSGDLTNIPLLIEVGSLGKPVILSTGMASLIEVKEAIRAIYSTGNRNLILLHCTSNYPARLEDVNLLAMDTLRKTFKVPVGYSDHTVGTEVAIAAVARGAAVIEKHFTLNKKMPGPDHRASLEPDELKKMVAAIRNIEKAIGDGIKRPRQTEKEMRRVARKSIVLNRGIDKGTKLTRKMLSVRRPGTGIAPRFISKLVGKRIKRSLSANKVLNWSLIS